MSKYMQIDVRLVPLYGSGGFASRFPNLARFLKNYSYNLVLEDEPSLYQMVDVVTRLKTDPAIPKGAKEPLIRMEPELVKRRDEARQMLLALQLKELDRCLYQIEDLFSDLEVALG
jgi:uncharacterized alpha/beta hydrolase family protein